MNNVLEQIEEAIFAHFKVLSPLLGQTGIS
jgi:hypothetical protein